MRGDVTTTSNGYEWPQFSTIPPIVIPTAHGPVFAQLATAGGSEILVITSRQRVEIPLVRFHSSCAFGEGIGATDCDCGVQLEAAVAAIVQDGGVITYAWEEGRGVGIVDKMRALALQQSKGMTTAEAFIALGHTPEPRTFANHVAALRQVFDGPSVRLASANPAKVKALEDAGIAVAERLKLDVPLTPERSAYVAGKVTALGHHR
jgi:GTP cyclohydrolase II